MSRLLSSLLVALLTLSFVTGSAAQGVQTGAIRGVVKDQTGGVLPGATIEAKSPALQGARETVSDQSGAYQFTGLPAGVYTVNFTVPGFQTATSELRIGLGAIERLDIALTVGVPDSVVVTAPMPS